MFRYLLVLANGEPADPPAFIVATPTWKVGDEFFTGVDEFWRILAIDTDIDEELVERGFHAVWPVEPIRGGGRPRLRHADAPTGLGWREGEKASRNHQRAAR